MKKTEVQSTYKNVVLISKDYDKVNGHQAGQNEVESLNLVNERAGLAVEMTRATTGEVLHLPIHQVLDMAIFAIESMGYLKESYRYPGFYDPEQLTVKRIGLQGESMGIDVCTENDDLERDIKTMIRRYGSMDEMLAQRLRILAEALEE